MNKRKLLGLIRYLQPWEMFRPDIVCDDISSVDIEQLESMGIDTVIADVDETLVKLNQPRIPAPTLAWFSILRKSGIQLGIVSNNRNGLHLASIQVQMGHPPVGLSSRFGPRPLPWSILKVLKEVQNKPQRIAIIGDSLICDILPGNLFFRALTIWIKPKRIPARQLCFALWMGRCFEKILSFLLLRLFQPSGVNHILARS